MAPSTLPLIFAPRFHFLDCKLLPRLGATTARVALGGDMGATTARVGLGGDVGATTARVALDGDEGACASLAFESFSIGTKLNNFETLHMSTHRRSVNRTSRQSNCEQNIFVEKRTGSACVLYIITVSVPYRQHRSSRLSC